MVSEKQKKEDAASALLTLVVRLNEAGLSEFALHTLSKALKDRAIEEAETISRNRNYRHPLEWAIKSATAAKQALEITATIPENLQR